MSVLNLKRPICQRSSARVVRRRMVANDTYICCLFSDKSLHRLLSAAELEAQLFPYPRITNDERKSRNRHFSNFVSITRQFRKVRRNPQMFWLKISTRSFGTSSFPVSTLIAKLCAERIKLIWMVKGRSKSRCLNSSL